MPLCLVFNTYDTNEDVVVDAHVRGLFSATAPLTYNNGTGVFSITQSGAASNGYLSSADWSTFNGKQDALSFPITVAQGGTGTTNRTLLDASSNLSLNWDSRAGADSGGLASMNWDNRQLYNSGTSTVVDWEALQLKDAFGNNTVLWGSGTLIQPGVGDSVDWFGRALTGTWSVDALVISSPLPVSSGGSGVSTFGGTNRLLYTTATDTLSSIATANTSSLVTSNTGVPSWTSGGTANRVLRTNGTTISFDQVALGTDVSGTLIPTLGGTGLNSFSQGDMIFASAVNTLSALAKNVTATRYLSNTGTSNNPAWAQINLANGVTGTLPVGNGGSGATSFTAGRLLIGNGISAFTTSANLTYSGTTLSIGTVTIDGSGEAITAAGDCSFGSVFTKEIFIQDTGFGGHIADDIDGMLLESGTTTLLVNGSANEINISASTVWVNGDLQVSGKITGGSIDPAYVIYDSETRERIKTRVMKEVPKDKQTGAALFFNSQSKRLETYVASEDAFYSLSGEKL